MRPHAPLKVSVRLITCPTRLHALSLQVTRSHVPLCASTCSHALHALLTSSHVSPCLHCCWRHLLASAADVILWLWVFDRWLLGWPLILTVRWLWPLTFLMVDFFSPGSSYPVFRVDFIFSVCFCILCLQMDKKDVFFLAPSILYWRGVRITYLGFKLYAVFLRVACSGITVLVQSLFLSREPMKKMLLSLVALIE